MCKKHCNVTEFRKDVSETLSDPSRELGFTLFKYGSKFVLFLNGKVATEISDAGRMYELNQFIIAYAMGLNHGLDKAKNLMLEQGLTFAT